MNAPLTSSVDELTVNAALGLLFLIALPLVCVARFWTSTSPSDPLLRYGRDARRAAIEDLLGRLGRLLLSSLVAPCVLLFVLYRGERALWTDLALSLPIAFCGAFALFGYFAAASAWAGRWGLLIALAVAWMTLPGRDGLSQWGPLAPINQLLGLTPEVTRSPMVAYAVLIATGALGFAAAVARMRR